MAWDNDRTNFDRNLAAVIGVDHFDPREIYGLQTAVNDASAIVYSFKRNH
jgi:hypothetical protein